MMHHVYADGLPRAHFVHADVWRNNQRSNYLHNAAISDICVLLTGPTEPGYMDGRLIDWPRLLVLPFASERAANTIRSRLAWHRQARRNKIGLADVPFSLLPMRIPTRIRFRAHGSRTLRELPENLTEIKGISDDSAEAFVHFIAQMAPLYPIWLGIE